MEAAHKTALARGEVGIRERKAPPEEAISRLEDYNRRKAQELTVNMQVQ